MRLWDRKKTFFSVRVASLRVASANFASNPFFFARAYVYAYARAKKKAPSKHPWSPADLDTSPENVETRWPFFFKKKSRFDKRCVEVNRLLDVFW